MLKRLVKRASLSPTLVSREMQLSDLLRRKEFRPVIPAQPERFDVRPLCELPEISRIAHFPIPPRNRAFIRSTTDAVCASLRCAYRFTMARVL